MRKWMAGVLVILATGAGAEDLDIAVRKGEILHVQSVGTGDAVVMVPGVLASGYGFRKLLDPLAAAGHRAIVIEPLGVGGSSRPSPADYSLTAQADRVASVLTALGVERAVLVAHATGASIAFRLAVRHPERVTAIVSLDGGPAEAAASAGFRRAMTWAPLLKIFGGMGRIRGKVRSTLKDRSADPAWVTEDVVDGYLGEARKDLDVTLGAYKQIAKAREPEALVPRLREIRVPVRLVVGTADRTGGMNPEEIAILQRSLPAFAIDKVAGAGHFVPEEKPQAVLAAVARVIRDAERIPIAVGR